MSTMLDDKVDTTTIHTDEGDHDRFAHYFAKKDLDKAFFDGATITALCGKKDVPTRDFTKYPKCPECEEIFQAMKD